MADRRVLWMLRDARAMSRREAIAAGLMSTVLLVVAVAAIANQPTNLLGWAAAVVLIPVGLSGMAIAAAALLRKRTSAGNEHRGSNTRKR